MISTDAERRETRAGASSVRKRLVAAFLMAVAGPVLSQDADVVQCTAVLVTIQHDYPVQSEGPGGIEVSIATLAMLEIDSPEPYVGQIVRVLFDGALSPIAARILPVAVPGQQRFLLRLPPEKLAGDSDDILLSSDEALEVVLITSGQRY